MLARIEDLRSLRTRGLMSVRVRVRARARVRVRVRVRVRIGVSRMRGLMSVR